MTWDQNSTKSTFSINKVPDDLVFPLSIVGAITVKFLEYMGVFESEDQMSFGYGNQGYRYFLNFSSPSKIFNSSSGLIPEEGFLPKIREGYDVPFKGMMILTEKQGDLYEILFMSPKDNFDSILNQIKATLDSIELSNSTVVTL